MVLNFQICESTSEYFTEREWWNICSNLKLTNLSQSSLWANCTSQISVSAVRQAHIVMMSLHYKESCSFFCCFVYYELFLCIFCRWKVHIENLKFILSLMDLDSEPVQWICPLHDLQSCYWRWFFLWVPYKSAGTFCTISPLSNNEFHVSIWGDNDFKIFALQTGLEFDSGPHAWGQ